MIRLVALACGLLCGAGLVMSGLHDPALLQDFLMPQETWRSALGLGLLMALVAAGAVVTLVVALAGNRDAPLLGGQWEPATGGAGWTSLVGAVMFGLGWGLAGYIPLTAMVAAGLFSPGASVFVISVLAGMIVHDALTGGFSRKGGGRGSFG